jgi:hypothetical protein
MEEWNVGGMECWRKEKWNANFGLQPPAKVCSHWKIDLNTYFSRHPFKRPEGTQAISPRLQLGVSAGNTIKSPEGATASFWRDILEAAVTRSGFVKLLSLIPQTKDSAVTHTLYTEGVAPSSPGLRRSGSYPGSTGQRFLFTPKGLRLYANLFDSTDMGATLSGLKKCSAFQPRVARKASQPWAGRRNAFGIKNDVNLWAKNRDSTPVHSHYVLSGLNRPLPSDAEQ